MNKGHLIRAVAERLELSHSEAEESIDAVLDEIARSLVRGEDVMITGLGSFKVVQLAERNGRNPKTGESLRIPARQTVRFKPGQRLLEHVRGEADAARTSHVIGKLAPSKKG